MAYEVATNNRKDSLYQGRLNAGGMAVDLMRSGDLYRVTVRDLHERCTRLGAWLSKEELDDLIEGLLHMRDCE